MPTYLVRIIDTRDLVGIFAANSIIQLIVAVDECTEPDGCEYALLPVGGIMWTGPAIQIPIPVPEDIELIEPDPMPWESASLTERWWTVMFGYENTRWKRFFPDEPRKSRKPTLPTRRKSAEVLPFARKRS